jgi:calcineurin-like phosphoesterase family protein
MCYGISAWDGKEINCRRFDILKDMNNAIVNSINSVVKEEDTLYFLGDWSFGGIENIWQFRQRIVCNNIHFITGNHDHHIKKNKELGRTKEDSEYFNNLGLHSIPIYSEDLFISINNYLELEIDKQIFVLSHYPMEEWFEMDRGSIHLHGHCIDEESEILTNEGFKKYNEISKDQQVYTFNKNTELLELSDIDSIILNNYTGKYYETDAFKMSMSITDEHTYVGINRNSKKYEEVLIKDYVNTNYSRINLIRSGLYNSIGIDLSDNELRLYICLAADGSITEYNLGRLRVQKDRKIQYFKTLLENLNIEYTENTSKDYTVCLNFKIPQKILDLNIKGLDSYLLNCNRHQCGIILESYLNTDGCLNGENVVIYSSKKSEIDILQHIFIINGYMAKVFGRDDHGFSKTTNYALTLADKTIQGFNPNQFEEKIAENKLFWCITTQNQNFFCRRNGFVYLTGNCHHKIDNHPINVNYRRMDVGIDWEEFRPYSLEEILQINKNKPFKKHLS